MLSFPPSFIAASVFIALTTAIPSQSTGLPDTLASQQVIDCTDITTNASYSPSCYTTLSIPTYLTNWYKTTSTCNASPNVSINCCEGGESWSTCFLRYATGVEGNSCTELGSPICPYDLSIKPGFDPSTAPQARFVLRNILAVNDFFTAYYGGQEEGAIQMAASAAGTMIGEIASSLDYNGKTVLDASHSLQALTLGLPFFGTPSLQNESLPNALLLKQIGKNFTQSLQQAPGVSAAIFPVTLSTTHYSLRFIAQQLPTSNFLGYMYKLLNAGLGLITSDIAIFLNFTAAGAWSGAQLIQPTDLTNSTPGIDFALATYVTSSTLAQQNFSITPIATSGAVDFDPLTNQQRQAHYNGTNILLIPASNQTLYWSPSTQRQYQFVYNGPNLKNGSIVNPYNVLKEIESNKWADLPVLFDGAYNCTLKNHPGAGSVVNIGFNGTLDVSCVSALPVLLGKEASCPVGAVSTGGKCPFEFRE